MMESFSFFSDNYSESDTLDQPATEGGVTSSSRLSASGDQFLRSSVEPNIKPSEANAIVIGAGIDYATSDGPAAATGLVRNT
jgi:hypothetical protein